ncbi:MAG: aspartyl protease family protein [Candidatus Eremiobacteraeota bacterium]|nr:aspartyl protease family protein [Candidatus Eremiobacteraeota bacterium]
MRQTYGARSVAAVALAALVIAATGQPPAVGQSVLPSAEDISAHVREVAGVRPAAEHATIAYTLGSASVIGVASGTQTSIRRNADTRNVRDEGPFHSEWGRLKGDGWHQNENGITVEESADPGLASADVFTTTVTAALPPYDGYIVSRLNAASTGTRDYVDASWRVVRHEEIESFATTVTAYDDFRRTGSFERPWHWVVDDGHGENHADYRLTALDYNQVADAEVAVPPDRRELVEFPAGTDAVYLPARFTRTGIIVRLDVGNRGLDFMLDSGAGEIEIEESVARQLKLPIYGLRSQGGAAQRFQASHTIVPSLRVGALSMRDVVVGTIPGLNVGPSGMRVVGLLGFDFLASVGVRLDFVAGTMLATRPATFAAPEASKQLNARLGFGSPLVDARVNGSLGERFVLDTGYSGSILLFDYFTRRYPQAIAAPNARAAGGDRRYSGVGGDFAAKPVVVNRVEFAGFTLPELTIETVHSRTTFSGRFDGLIGLEVLRRFDVYFDYANSRFFLTRNV